jgi:hypothetical protein
MLLSRKKKRAKKSEKNEKLMIKEDCHHTLDATLFLVIRASEMGIWE